MAGSRCRRRTPRLPATPADQHSRLLREAKDILIAVRRAFRRGGARAGRRRPPPTPPIRTDFHPAPPRVPRAPTLPPMPRTYASIFGRSGTDAPVIMQRVNQALRSENGDELVRMLAFDRRRLTRLKEAANRAASTPDDVSNARSSWRANRKSCACVSERQLFSAGACPEGQRPCRQHFWSRHRPHSRKTAQAV